MRRVEDLEKKNKGQVCKSSNNISEQIVAYFIFIIDDIKIRFFNKVKLLMIFVKTSCYCLNNNQVFF